MYYATISGSFRKFLKEIKEYIREFEKNGVTILSPNVSKIKNENNEFIYFKSDKRKPIKIIEKTHLLNISHSDFLFIVNPNGYIGTSSLLEIGYALANNKKIFSSNSPNDVLLKDILISNKTIPEILEIIPSKKLENNFQASRDLFNLQKYMRRKVIERGFENESERDVLLLLVEEIGELSRIIRLYSGLKVKRQILNKQNLYKIEEELADIFIYLLILANKYGINLYESFKSKELENEKVRWARFDPNSEV